MSGFDDDLHTQRSLGRWLPEIPEVPLEQRYEVAGELIGKGGFGDVYRAKKRLLPQWVAVKRLRSDTGEHPPLDEQRRFVREVTLAASLDHPHIVRIEDWGRDAQGLYVVMALIEGGSLLQQVEQHGAVPLGKLLQYARQICLGLQAAHQQGIIHRDLKPANMLLDKTGRVLLADFGLARSSSGSREALIHSSGKPKFSIAYASPEQMVGESLDVRTDLFSLGATLYHLAAGQPAYDRDFDLDAIPAELHALISGLLKKKRDQRPATVDVVLEQLNELQKRRMAAQMPPPSPAPVPQPVPEPASQPASPKPSKELSVVPAKALEPKLSRPQSPLPSAAKARQSPVRAATNRRPTRWRRQLAIGTALAGVCWIAVVMLDSGWQSVVTSQSSPSTESPAAVAEVPEKKAPADSPPGQPVTRPELLQAPFSPAAATAAQTAWAAYLKRDVQVRDTFGHDLVLIPAGSFLMGSPDVESGRGSDEGPEHRVEINKPFYMGRTEVTQGQWKAVMGTEPWKDATYAERDDQNAASCIDWYYAAEFCRLLSQMEGKTYRLPTEAEWEYACRAGTSTCFSFGFDKKQLGQYAWFDNNAFLIFENYAHGVGQKKPNAFGLHDVHGNVWEWCSDWYGTYPSVPLSDPHGPSSGTLRVSRGGSWDSNLNAVRCAYRNNSTPDYGDDNHGLRLVLDPIDNPLSITTAAETATPVDTTSNTRAESTAVMAQLAGKKTEQQLKTGDSAAPAAAMQFLHPPEPLEAPFSQAAASTAQAAWASYLKRDVQWQDDVGHDLVLIPTGSFLMGDPNGKPGVFGDGEGPQHRVEITKPFYLGRTEVTQRQWRLVMGTEPWKGESFAEEGDRNAAGCISWNEALEFCRRLSHREGKTYRLPTEAEWEYACRAGTTTRFSFGHDDSRLGEHAWFRDNTELIDEDYAHRVEQKRPNAFGLYDMHGNVAEWCSDWYDGDYYSSSPLRDPSGPTLGSANVSRGGSWCDTAHFIRSTNRNVLAPDRRFLNHGFRLVLE